MKEKIFNLIIIVISIFVLLELLFNKSVIYSSVMLALKLWVNNLIPVLFPFFIISNILINYKIIDYIPKNFKNLCKKVFNINDNMLMILFLSILSGFPSNAKNTRLLYDKGIINDAEANHIILFSHFANPMFVLTVVGVFFLHSEKLGIIILISHYLSNICLGVMFRKGFKNNYYDINLNNTSKVNLGGVLISAIKDSIDTILLICGIVIVFLILAAIIVDTFNFNIYNAMIIKGLFEITIGMQALSYLKIGLYYKAVIASCFLAFGGMSVHIQVLSQLIDTKIKYSYFFMGRLYQMILSGIITYILCIVYNI